MLFTTILRYLQVNTVNDAGLTPLMIAAVNGDEGVVRMLLDVGCSVDTETPASSHAQTSGWTALTYASVQGHVNICKLLLDRGATVEGGGGSEEKSTETPLQVINKPHI